MNNREMKFRAFYMNAMFGDREAKRVMYNESCEIRNVDAKIMQYTGLKDADGTDVYEGDILRLDDKKDKDVVVEFGDCYELLGDDGFYGWFLRMIHRNDGCHLNTTIQYGMRVIGNIYQTPELLE